MMGRDGWAARSFDATRDTLDGVRDARRRRRGEYEDREWAGAEPRLLGLMPVMRTEDGWVINKPKIGKCKAKTWCEMLRGYTLKYLDWITHLFYLGLYLRKLELLGWLLFEPRILDMKSLF